MKGATESHSSRWHRKGVSIHAPVKGATLKRVDDLRDLVVSIHAPVKGATGAFGSTGEA